MLSIIHTEHFFLAPREIVYEFSWFFIWKIEKKSKQLLKCRVQKFKNSNLDVNCKWISNFSGFLREIFTKVYKQRKQVKSLIFAECVRGQKTAKQATKYTTKKRSLTNDFHTVLLIFYHPQAWRLVSVKLRMCCQN